MIMEIRVLHYFLTVAREESFSKAAEVLHVTQPTLSRQIKDLEDEYGKKFFNRNSRYVSLTDDGMLFKKRAEEILRLVDKTESELLAPEETLSGDIYIGGGESECVRIIAKVVAKMQKKHPHVIFHFYSGNAQDVSEKLDNGLIDFGIFIDPVDLKKYDFMRLPSQDTWGVYMRSDCELAQNEYITPQDLRNLPIIISNQDMVKNEISGWIGGNQRNLNIVATYNLIYNASLLLEEGVGYLLSLDHLIHVNNQSLLCFRPLMPKLSVGLEIVWKKYQVFSKPAECFINMLQKEIIEE